MEKALLTCLLAYLLTCLLAATRGENALPTSSFETEATNEIFFQHYFIRLRQASAFYLNKVSKRLMPLFKAKIIKEESGPISNAAQ